MMELFRVDGKVAMITGGGRGTGRTIALALAEAGAKIAVCARNAAELQRTVDDIEAAGGEALAHVADVTREADLRSFVEATMSRFGRIDALVNNAGGNVAEKKQFFDWSQEEFQHLISWNLTSVFLLSQLAGRHMIEAGQGVIVNISSEAGRFPSRGSAPYATAKAGMAHLTGVMAQELGPKVRVNALSLGAIMTPLLANVLNQQPGMRERLAEGTPLRKIGDPACVAMATVFLCSEASSYITGATIPVSGGVSGSSAAVVFPDL